MSDISIPVEFTSDEKGYYDRQCPNDKCEFVFKIYMEDWKDKISDEQVFCPLIGKFYFKKDLKNKSHKKEICF